MNDIKSQAPTTAPLSEPPNDHHLQEHDPPYSQDAYQHIIFRSLFAIGSPTESAPTEAPLSPPSDHVLTPPASARGDITPAASASRPSSPRTMPGVATEPQHQQKSFEQQKSHSYSSATMGAPPENPEAHASGVDDFVQAINNLTSDNNFKLVRNVFSEVLRLKERTRDLSLSNRELFEQYRSFRNDLEDDLKAKMAEKDRVIADITDAKNELASQKADLEATVEARDTEIDGLKTAKAGLEADKAELEGTVEAKNTELAQLGAAKTQVEEEKAGVEATLAERVQELADLNVIKTALENDKAELEQQVVDKDKEIASLSDTKAKLETDLAELREIRSRLEKELEDTNAKFDQHRKEAEAAATAAADEIASLKQTIVERDEELATTKSELSDVTAKHEAAKTRIGTLETDLQSMTDLADERKTKIEDLEADLKAARERIATLESELTAMTERADAEKKRADGLQIDLDNTTARAENAEARIKELDHDLADMTAQHEEATANVHRLEGTLYETEEMLRDRSGRLNELESYRVTLKNEPEDVYVGILDKIWTNIAALVEMQFRQDLDASVLADASCWANLRGSEYLKQARQAQIPLPQSNSAAAKQMRVAAVLAVLSRSLHRHVFRPVYLVDDDGPGSSGSSSAASHGNGHSPNPDRDILARLLRAMDAETPSREAHFRATLLAALPERQRASAARRARAVAREVSWLVQHLLSALQFEDFCARLEAACTLACMEWIQIQHANMRIEAYFGPPYEDLDWQVLPLPQFDGPDGAEAPARRDVVVRDADDQDEGALVAGDDHDDTTVEIGGSVRGDEGRGEPVHSDVDDIRPVQEELDVEPEEIMLVVWPSMCAVEHGHLESITQGLVISKDQVRHALEEVRGRGRNKPSTRRARTLSRTLSIPGRGSSVGAVGRSFRGDGESME